MDSLTQIVLGAAVGEVVLGKKVGNKAMLYGAIAGTIPDLDTFASHFVSTVDALAIHRGFTHSIFFAVLFAPIMGWLISRFEKAANFKDWSWLFFWGFLTHPLLDAHTTWGTQLFWPLDLRLAYKNIFVIDPLYTLPFLVCVLAAMRLPKKSARRKNLNKWGLILSTTYLGITLLLKFYTYQHFKRALNDQGISYTAIETKPTAFNSLLWTANVDTDSHYLIGHYTIFDTQPIHFSKYLKNHFLLDTLRQEPQVKKLLKITEGWYNLEQKEDYIVLNDLRFGLLSLSPQAKDFVFSYTIKKNKDGSVSIEEREKNMRDGKKLIQELITRIQGN